MPGVVQVWLTDKELAMLRAWGLALILSDHPNGSTADEALYQKIKGANEAITCAQPQPCSVCGNVRNKADGSVAYCLTCRSDPEDGGG